MKNVFSKNQNGKRIRKHVYKLKYAEENSKNNLNQ